ncbi:hypothetical protein Pcinc_040955, partial [Petrolisthes cinctipes]
MLKHGPPLSPLAFAKLQSDRACISANNITSLGPKLASDWT